MGHGASGTFAVLDLARGIVLFRFLEVSRHWLFFALFICTILASLTLSLVSFALVAAIFLSYLVVINPNRICLLLWTYVLMVTTAFLALWSFARFIDSLSRDFSFALLIPITIVVLFFWISWRVLRRPDIMADRKDKPAFIIMGISKSHGGFTDPSLPETWYDAWMSGGWRSQLVLGLPLIYSITFMGAKVIPSCFFLGLGLACALSIPWVLIPVHRSLNDGIAMGLISSVACNREHARLGSYRLFVLRNALKNPMAIIWFVLPAFIFFAAIVWLGWISSRPESGDLDKDLFFGALQNTWTFGVLLAFAASVLCFRLGRRHALQIGTTEKCSETDSFTLYLRSFADDKAEVLRDGLLFRVWFVERLFNILRFVRFEEILTETVWPFSRMLALARPGERLPQSGAVRIATPQADWQGVITSTIRRADSVLMTMGFTSGVKWEFQQLLASADITKLSLLLLPDEPESRLRIWRGFISNSPHMLSCPEEIVARSIAIKFGNDEGLPIFLMAERPSVAAYRLALNTCWLPLSQLSIVSRSVGGQHRPAGIPQFAVGPWQLSCNQTDFTTKRGSQELGMIPKVPFNWKALITMSLLVTFLGGALLPWSIWSKRNAAKLVEANRLLLDGNSLFTSGQYEQAIAEWRKAVALNPAFPEAHTNIGLALYIQGRSEEAVAEYRKAIALKPDLAEAYTNLGQALSGLGRYDEAVEECRTAIALKRDLAEAYANLGQALSGLAKYDEAVEECRTAIALKPDLAEAHYNLADALTGLGQVDEAFAEMEKALALRGNNRR